MAFYTVYERSTGFIVSVINVGYEVDIERYSTGPLACVPGEYDLGIYKIDPATGGVLDIETGAAVAKSQASAATALQKSGDFTGADEVAARRVDRVAALDEMIEGLKAVAVISNGLGDFRLNKFDLMGELWLANWASSEFVPIWVFDDDTEIVLPRNWLRSIYRHMVEYRQALRAHRRAVVAALNSAQSIAEVDAVDISYQP